MRHSKTQLAALAAAVGAILNAHTSITSAQEIEEVMVTGTRIQRATGFTTPVPVTSVSSAEITTFAPGNTIAEGLDKLPQFFGSQTAQRGGHPQFSAGRSSLDMRGMGHQRTLVLIDGARTVPADNSSNVNVDFIPTALIERVDVVTGGASAAYGADALAGVVNFVLDRDFEGFRANVQAGQLADGDGDNWRFSLTGGTAFGASDQWHVTWSVEGQQIDKISRDGSLGAERPEWMRHLGFVSNPEWFPGAPASIPRQLVMPDVHGTGSSPTGIINGAFRRENPLDLTTTRVEDFPYLRHVFTIDGTSTFPYPYGEVGCYRGDPNSPVPLCTTDATSGGPMYELQKRAHEWGIFGDEVQRRNAFLGIERDLGDSASVFAHLIYGESESNKLDWLRPPWLNAPWSATVHRDNAYLPQEIRDAMDATGANELQLDVRGIIREPGFMNFADSQDAINKSTTWTLALGFEKELFGSGNWQLRGAFQRGETDKIGGLLPESRIDRIVLAMDAVEVYSDRRDADGDGVVDLIADADRGTGEIICNVNRYNPTDEELRLSVISVTEGGTRPAALGTVLVPAAFGDDSLASSPEELVRIPGPVSMIDNTIQDCVPFNIMGTGHTSPEAARYLVSEKYDNGAVTQEFAEVVLSGEFSEGIGAGPFALATGASWRQESFWQRPFPRELMAYGPPTNAPHLGIRGIAAGWASNRNVHLFTDFPAIKGEFSVREMFAELDLPLLQTAKDRSIATNLAVRRSDYSLSGGITSAKIGLDIGLSESLRLRATASRDVREPTFSERFDVLGGGATVNDPLTGVFNFFTFANSLGNPALEPEHADTVTAGFVYEPTAVSGLQIAVDYWKIDLKDQIDLLPNNTIVQTCYDTRDTTRTYCDFIKRDPISNLITIIQNRFVNVATSVASGIDLEVLWNKEVDFLGLAEALDLRVMAGWLDENSQLPFGATQPIERAGTINYPDFTALATLGYTAGRYRVRLVGHYRPETILNMDWHTRPMQSCGAAACVPDTTVESQFVTNLSIGYQHELSNGGNWEASLTVSNLFDTAPPVIPTGAGDNLAQDFGPVGYEFYGRQFVVQFGYNF